jgi:proteasome lid subunit RPN8/RPN11
MKRKANIDRPSQLPESGEPILRIRIDAEILRRIRQHARTSMNAEVCGVLIGDAAGNRTEIEACIPGEQARQGGSHVTFTQDTWTHIYEVKDKQYPDKRIVGWYHSHPGFGVFLSDHDLFIHRNFFSSPNQIAWVYDPHSDEEGCFAWRQDNIVRVVDFAMHDETVGRVGVEEPAGPGSPGEEYEELPSSPARSGPRIARWVGLVLTHVFALILGFGIAAMILPQVILVPDHGGPARQEPRK